MNYYVYILECKDKTLYTGSTSDIEKRVLTHNTKKTAASYTKSRRPVKLVYSEQCASKSEALKREYVIKQLTRIKKKELIRGAVHNV